MPHPQRAFRQYELEARIHDWRRGLEQTEEWGAWQYFLYGGMEKKDAPLLQWWGTEYRRAFFGEDYWVKKAEDVVSDICLQSYAVSPDLPVRVAIADTRFPDEGDWIKKQGGVVWDIVRSEPIEETGRPADHPSEVALDGYAFDDIIENEGSKEDLFSIVEASLDPLLRQKETA